MVDLAIDTQTDTDNIDMTTGMHARMHIHVLLLSDSVH